MGDRIVPIISDSSYRTSSWHKEIISSLRSTANRAQFQIQVFSGNLANIKWAALPPVVIVTSGTLAYINYVTAKLRAEKKLIVLACLDAENFGEDISCATPSRRYETSHLIHYFICCNRKGIALVGFRKDSINDMTRYHAALSSCIAYGLNLDDDAAYFWDMDLIKCLDIFLAHASRYNAVVCPNDATAVHLINRCIEKGIRVPEDLYIASFGNMLIGNLCHPSLTTIAIDYAAVGVQTFKIWHLLCSKTNRDTAFKIIVPSKLIVRSSTENQLESDCYLSTYLPDVMDTNDLADYFYEEPNIQTTIKIENCLLHRDALDYEILMKLFGDFGYEKMAEDLFVSVSSIHYRVNKIFSDAGVGTRAEFEKLIRDNMRCRNPFAAQQANVLLDKLANSPSEKKSRPVSRSSSAK